MVSRFGSLKKKSLRHPFTFIIRSFNHAIRSVEFHSQKRYPDYVSKGTCPTYRESVEVMLSMDEIEVVDIAIQWHCTGRGSTHSDLFGTPAAQAKIKFPIKRIPKTFELTLCTFCHFAQVEGYAKAAQFCLDSQIRKNSSLLGRSTSQVWTQR